MCCKDRWTVLKKAGCLTPFTYYKHLELCLMYHRSSHILLGEYKPHGNTSTLQSWMGQMKTPMRVRKGCITKGQLQSHEQNLGSKHHMVASNSGNYHLLSKGREKNNGQVLVWAIASEVGLAQWEPGVFPNHHCLPTSDRAIPLTSREWGEAGKSIRCIWQSPRAEHKAGTRTRAKEAVEENLPHIVKGICLKSSLA